MTENPHLPPFKLSVYTSPRDGKTVLAYGTYPAIIEGNRAVWPCVIRFGTPVQKAFDIATAFAARNGIAVEVDDPHGLLPPELRVRRERWI
jgi:hypothetical protein